MFPPISLWARLRIYAVRVLIVASILDIIEFMALCIATRDFLDPTPYTEAVWVTLFVVMPLHHALAVLGPWRPLINLIDLTLLIAETVLFAYFSRHDFYQSFVFSLPISAIPRGIVLCVLCIDRLILAAWGLRKGPKYLLKPVRLIPKRERPLLTRWQILCGRHVLSSHLLGETKRIIFPRFALASASILYIFGYLYYIVLVRPFLQDALWVRQIPIEGTWVEVFGTSPLELTLMFTPSLCYDKRSGGNDVSGVTFATYWNPPQAGSCSKLEVPVGDDEEQRVCVEYSCPFISFPKYAASTNIAATPPFNMTVNPTKAHPFLPSSIPELLVTYNFSNPVGPRNEVYINFKMSKSVKGLQKIRLTRGSHDVVSYMIDVWDEMKPEVMFSFRGLLKDTERRRATYVREISRSYDATRDSSTYGPTVGSIRLLSMPQDLWVLNQLAFKGEVFDGLASTGGIWTLLNGIFLIICGRGLLDILLGHRALSATGLLHYLIPKTLRAETKAGYPQVEEDRKLKGLPALIVNYFAEIDMFVGGEGKGKVDDSDDEKEDLTPAHSLQDEDVMEMGETVGNDSGRRLENDSMPLLPLVPLRKKSTL